MPSDPHLDAPDAIQGYIALIGAILRQALADTRLTVRHGQQGQTHPTHADHEDARALLLSRERLTFFCELMGAEVTRVQPALLKAAGFHASAPRHAGEGGRLHKIS
jgi:hypothetical protein